MDELSMTVFALVVLLAIDFPAVFLYTKAKTAWAFAVFVNIVVTQFNIKRLKPHWH